MSNQIGGELPTIYLAGKVGGDKWEIIKGLEGFAAFVASDGSTHGEHKWGYWEHRFGELKREVADNCIGPLSTCDILIAYLDKPNSFGSIAEIAYASALGKNCYIILLDPTYEASDCGNFSPLYDPYWLISSFPNVATAVVSSIEEARDVVARLAHSASVEILLNDFRKTLESPMEERFALALFNRAVGLTWGEGGGPVVRADFGSGPVQIHSQYPVNLARPYRLDFLIEAPTLNLVVEIDGHDFHERTKEQARRDKERDRALTAAGYTVFRFTGSEIYHGVDQAVAEVVFFLSSKGE